MMTRPFLDDWIARCCGLDVLSEGSLLRYQLHKINEVLRYAERRQTASSHPQDPAPS